MPKQRVKPKSVSEKWYSIRAAGEGVAEILIYGDIGDSWFSESVTAKKFVEDLQGLADKDIVVRINSYGGSVADGVAIHNAIRRHPKAKSTAIDGVAVSIASLIALAGDELEMAENAILMIHDPWGSAQGNSTHMRRYADVLDKFADAMAESYARHTGQTKEEALALVTSDEEFWFTAEEALEAGLIDKITEDAPAEEAARYRAAVLSRFQVPAAVAAAFQPKEIINMPLKTPKQPATPDVVETDDDLTPEQKAEQAKVAQIGDAAAKKERARIAARNIEIRAAAKPFLAREGLQALVDSLVDDTNITLEQAREKILAKLGEGAEPLNQIRPGAEDACDKFIAAARNALIVRSGVHRLSGNGNKALDIDLSGNPYRGATLLEMAKAALRLAGQNPDGMDKMEIVGQAFQTTSDFPTLLENVMHKTLQQAYITTPDTWSRFCTTGSVGDFRDHNRYRVGSIGNLDSVPEHGEFKRKTIPDGEKAKVAATTKGNIIAVSRQTVINDDLGALTNLATMFGRAARRSIEADVYVTLALNANLGPTLLDGKSLFHADHGNISTGAALSVDALDADRVLMASQKDVGGNDYLDLRPAVLLVAIGIGGSARVINDAQYDPDTANKLQRPNKVRGLFRDIVDTPRLAGTRRYLFADPAEAPVLEVAFLDGNQNPFLESKDGWNVDGAELKVRLDYGVAGVDFRGAVTNAGV